MTHISNTGGRGCEYKCCTGLCALDCLPSIRGNISPLSSCSMSGVLLEGQSHMCFIEQPHPPAIPSAQLPRVNSPIHFSNRGPPNQKKREKWSTDKLVCYILIFGPYLFAWLVQRQRSYPLCCSSIGGVWTGTGTLWCPSWHLHRCIACGPGKAGIVSSGPGTSPPAGCTEAEPRWCRPQGLAVGSWLKT